MVIFTAFWEVLLPIRRACGDGVFRFMYDLMPTVIALTVVYAQWHLVLTVCLVLGAIMFSAWFAIALRREERSAPTSRKERKINRIMAKRVFVLALSSVLAIPAVISGLVYRGQPPVLTPGSPSVSFAAPGAEESVFQVNGDLLRQFSEESWRKHSVGEKLSLLNELAKLETWRLGIPEVEIKSQQLFVGTLGEYSSETEELFIDLPHLDRDSAEECITTMCHEVYHAYQKFQLDSFDGNDPDSGNYALLKAWKENSENYQNAIVEGYDAYADQPLEKSAFDYAGIEAAAILGALPEGQ